MVSRGPHRVKGIVLAGVHAWGGAVLEQICARPLLPIAGRPLIGYGLEWLRRMGVTDVTICANSDTHVFQSVLGDGESLGLRLDYYEDSMPRGPAGCTRDAALRSNGETFVVIEGSLLPRMNPGDLLRAHERSRASLTVVAVKNQQRSETVSAAEPAGVYICSRSAMSLISSRGYQDIKEMWIPKLYQERGRTCLYAVTSDEAVRVMNVGSYLRAIGRVLSGCSDPLVWGDEYRQEGMGWVHRRARVDASVRVSGPSLVGPEACLESRVAIMGTTLLGPNSQVGAGAILNNVVAWSGCRIGRRAILTNCLLLPGSCVEDEVVVRDTVWSGGDARPLSPAELTAEYYNGLSSPALREDQWPRASAAALSSPAGRQAAIRLGTGVQS